MSSAPSRYPGTRAFEREEAALFFGREQEVLRLLAQVKAHRLVVVFAKSGIGKSSLINAGLLPLLEEEPYQPVKIRLQNLDIPPIEMVKNELKPFYYPDLFPEHTVNGAAHHLWEYLKCCEFWQEGEAATPVLIFDQFEEFFDHPVEARDAFMEELADLLSERLPDRIQAALRQSGVLDEAEAKWFAPIPMKIVLAIRSDRLSLLDELSYHIPGILQNRFNLKPLNQAQASEAMLRPASLSDAAFDSPPFSFNAETLQKILRQLMNKQGEIESFQLQLICQYIEKQVKERYGNA